MRSLPSTRRAVVAAVLLAAGFALAVYVKRDRGTPLLPPGAAGVLPNFLCSALGPLVAFLGPLVISARAFLLFDVLLLAGLCGYEVAQNWMPRRTFDPDDIRASVAGAGVAAALGFALFLRRGSGEPPGRA